MKLAIISDTHLGFAPKSEREQDSYYALRQAFELAGQQRVDFILIPGDLFDHSIPSQECWHESFQLFAIPKKFNSSNVKIFKQTENKSKEVLFDGIPVLAIHGTHEFRGRDYKNALHVLDSAKALIYFHAEALVVEKGNEKLAVFGLGGVPEKKALDALRMLDPKPLPGAKNVFVFHQSLSEFLPTDDEMSVTLSLTDLPKGFDLYVNGHLHWHNELEVNGAKFVLAGSTIFTQMKKLESEKPKGITIYDTELGTTLFLPLPVQRKLFYHKMKFENASLEQVYAKIREAIEEDLRGKSFELKPLIRVKVVGSLLKGLNQSDLGFDEIVSNYSGKAIFSIDKNFFSEEFKSRISELRDLQQSNKSIASLGLEFLEKNLQETSFGNAFDVKQLFDLLAEGEMDKATEYLDTVKQIRVVHDQNKDKALDKADSKKGIVQRC